MKILVVYDSAHGNTEQIAKAIAGTFNTLHDVEVSRVDASAIRKLSTVDLIIAGSPTYGGRPTPPMLEFLNNIPGDGLKGVKIAAFDTRLTNKLVSIFGFAAGKIASQLKGKGGNPVAEPAGFFVKGSKGPLKDGEIERAVQWAREIASSITQPSLARS